MYKILANCSQYHKNFEKPIMQVKKKLLKIVMNVVISSSLEKWKKK